MNASLIHVSIFLYFAVVFVISVPLVRREVGNASSVDFLHTKKHEQIGHLFRRGRAQAPKNAPGHLSDTFLAAEVDRERTKDQQPGDGDGADEDDDEEDLLFSASTAGDDDHEGDHADDDAKESSKFPKVQMSSGNSKHPKSGNHSSKSRNHSTTGAHASHSGNHSPNATTKSKENHQTGSTPHIAHMRNKTEKHRKSKNSTTEHTEKENGFPKLEAIFVLITVFPVVTIILLCFEMAEDEHAPTLLREKVEIGEPFPGTSEMVEHKVEGAEGTQVEEPAQAEHVPLKSSDSTADGTRNGVDTPEKAEDASAIKTEGSETHFADGGDEASAKAEASVKAEAPEKVEGAQKSTAEVSIETAFLSTIKDKVGKNFWESVQMKADAEIFGNCKDPGIFLVMWATRKLHAEQVLVFMAAFPLQLFIPCFLFPLDESFSFDMPANASVEAQIAQPLLALFLISNVKTVLQRAHGMQVLKGASEEFKPALAAGVMSLILTCIVSWLGGFYLFTHQQTAKDMLLKVCAVKFIPNIDKILVSMLGATGSSSAAHLNVAKDRLEKVANSWKESKERQAFIEWLKLPFSDQVKARPIMFVIFFAEQLLVIAGYLCLVFYPIIVVKAMFS